MSHDTGDTPPPFAGDGGAAAQAGFKKQLGLIDLTFIGLGAVFGSGWLFSASYVAAIAGPAASCRG
jgi:amino acid transporter